MQILAYADDIDIIARTESTMKEERASGNVKLIINEGKIKYIFCGKRKKILLIFEIDHHRFENVIKFADLGSEIEYQNEISPEIR